MQPHYYVVDQDLCCVTAKKHLHVALGQKQTFHSAIAMSALPQKRTFIDITHCQLP